MIEVAAALCGVKDAGLVCLEDSLVGLDKNRNGLSCKCSLHLRDILGFEETGSDNFDFSGIDGVLLARSFPHGLSRLIWVILLKNGAVLAQVMERPEGIASEASQGRKPLAVDELLLRE